MDDTGPPNPTVAELVEEHYAVLYRYAFRLCGDAAEAEDLTQQAFLNAQRKLEQLRNPAAARGWLCAILRNVYLLELRGKGPRSVPLDATEEPAAVDGTGDWEVDTEALQTALAELPEHYRTCLILYYFEDLSYREIAEVVEAPVGTVMSRLSRGKDFLRHRLSRSTIPAGWRGPADSEPT